MYNSTLMKWNAHFFRLLCLSGPYWTVPWHCLVYSQVCLDWSKSTCNCSHTCHVMVSSSLGDTVTTLLLIKLKKKHSSTKTRSKLDDVVATATSWGRLFRYCYVSVVVSDGHWCKRSNDIVIHLLNMMVWNLDYNIHRKLVVSAITPIDGGSQRTILPGGHPSKYQP